MSEPDVVIVGSGPNGLAAGVCLAQAGVSVLVLEAKPTVGGGLRTAALTLPGFAHDVCSAVHPMAILSPYLRQLPLEEHGLTWIRPTASLAHPLDEGPAVLLPRALDATCAELGRDAGSYRRLVTPYLGRPHALLEDVLAPLGFPRHPGLMLRFGLQGLASAIALARRFQGARARALVAGCAAHAILPLETPLTAAVSLLFLITAHTEEWPVAAGGSEAIAKALTGLLKSLGGHVETDRDVRTLADLPPARAYLFDTSPAQLAAIAGPVLPPRYVRRLRRYRYGPGAFKLDWALDGSIPWKDARCLKASTVHLGGTLEEIAASEAAVWRGEHPPRPFVLLCQQSELDSTRAPAGKHTGWAYCHVPAASTQDMTDAIESQVERFAPGFKRRILARHVTAPADLQRYNANYVGGAITGGVADMGQLFTRPVARLNPYTTPHPRLFICSASSPPGGGVHGMCGYHAAQAALRRLPRLQAAALTA